MNNLRSPNVGEKTSKMKEERDKILIEELQRKKDPICSIGEIIKSPESCKLIL